MRKLLTLLVALFLLSGMSIGADQPDFPDIYIEAGVGGTHVGSQANPYDDLSDINWTTGGDNSIFDYLAGSPSQSPTINLNKGDTWEELMTVVTSGTATYPILIGSYGAGNKPIINASDDVIGVGGDWTDETGNVWSRSLTTECKGVMFDTTQQGTEDATPDAQYDWDWVANELFVYSVGNPTGYYTSIEVTQRIRCITSNGKDYYIVDGLELRNGINTGAGGGNDGACFEVYNGTEVDIQNCDIYHPFGRAVRYQGCADCTIDNNLMDTRPIDNGYEADGLVIAQGSGGHVVSHNTIYQRVDGYYTDAIQTVNEDGFTIEHNWLEFVDGYESDSGTMLIQLETVSASGTFNVNGNVLWNNDSNQGSCMIFNGAQTFYGYNNIIINLAGTGDASGAICIECTVNTPKENWTLKNNIFWANNNYVGVFKDGVVAAQLNYNCWYRGTGADIINDADTGRTWAEMQGQTYETNGYNADPLFVDGANYDFTLQSGSTCIETGVDVGQTEDIAGTTIPQGNFPEIGAYEYPANILRIREILRIRNVLRIK